MTTDEIKVAIQDYFLEKYNIGIPQTSDTMNKLLKYMYCDDNGNLRIEYIRREELTDDDEPNIPADAHIALVHGTVFELMSRSDRESDVTRSGIYLGKYKRYIHDYSEAQIMNKNIQIEADQNFL